MEIKSDLSRIIRLAMVKVVPGVFNIALIPFLLATLGAVNYGLYSTWLGYAMLVANTVAAIVSQPMYRYLSSRPEERESFASFAIGASGLAGLASFGVASMVGAPWPEALGFAALSTGTVLGTAVSIGFVIGGQIVHLAAYEMLRILAIFLALAIPLLAGRQLTVGIVVFAMAVANVLPIFVMARRQSFRLMEFAWMKQILPYGIKSATWLFLAGLPIVSAKSMLMQAMPENAFGTYAAIADLTYRGFSIANAALIMWAFPLLSQQFDSGKFLEVRRTLRFALFIYALIGGAIVVGMIFLVEGLSLFDVSILPGGLFAAIAITLGSFGWQGMSISHKPLELTLRTSRMVVLMAFGVIAFYGMTFGLTRLYGFDTFYVVMMSLIFVSLGYSAVSVVHKILR